MGLIAIACGLIVALGALGALSVSQWSVLNIWSLLPVSPN